MYDICLPYCLVMEKSHTPLNILTPPPPIHRCRLDLSPAPLCVCVFLGIKVCNSYMPGEIIWSSSIFLQKNCVKTYPIAIRVISYAAQNLLSEEMRPVF